MADVLAEVRHLLDYGFVEIELLGQTVNHWRDPGTGADFADLLDQVAQLRGLRRLRFVTSYPRDFTQAMVDQFARHPDVISPYLHLPVQSGSNAVLRMMGRGYEIELYDDLIERLRQARPDIALSTDLIVGFPGETDEDFEKTLELVRRVRYGSLFAFKYSPRPGTAAPRLKVPAVPDQVADQRLQASSPSRTASNTHQSEPGWPSLRGPGDQLGKQPGTQTGRTPCHRLIHFPYGDAPLPLGQITRVRVERGLHHSLVGQLVA